MRLSKRRSRFLSGIFFKAAHGIERTQLYPFALMRVTISAVAREAGVSSSLLHNHYPEIAEEIRVKQGASTRKKLDAKQDELSVERGKIKALRAELEDLRHQVAKLASINEMLQIENHTLAIKCGTPKIATFPSHATRMAVVATPN
jgi:AcrR family transcriptional regulator